MDIFRILLLWVSCSLSCIVVLKGYSESDKKHTSQQMLTYVILFKLIPTHYDVMVFFIHFLEMFVRH